MIAEDHTSHQVLLIRPVHVLHQENRGLSLDFLTCRAELGFPLQNFGSEKWAAAKSIRLHRTVSN